MLPCGFGLFFRAGVFDSFVVAFFDETVRVGVCFTMIVDLYDLCLRFCIITLHYLVGW